MAYEYKLGEQLELPVSGRGIDSNGYEYIIATHNEANLEHRIYSLLKCQESETPSCIYVKVANVDPFGKAKIKQDKKRVYEDHYKIGETYEFKVVEIGEDQNQKPFYKVEDELDYQRYYGEPGIYRIGDTAELTIRDINDNFLEFDNKGNKKTGGSHSKTIEVKTDNSRELNDSLPIGNYPVLDIEDESQTLELKTSIVFPPANQHQPDIDQQILNIIKVLVAFMNADGGTLYIGIHDKTKQVTGIREDYEHLNDSDVDTYTYSRNHDGYKLKIRNEVDRLCTAHANSLIKSITFPVEQGVEYCKIEVEKGKRPVWLLKSQLWIRQGNRLKRLEHDEITLHIYETLGTEKEILDRIEELLSNNPVYSMPSNLPLPKPKGETDYKVLWFDDKTWVRTKQEDRYEKPIYSIEVPKNPAELLVVFCYPSGNVNTIPLTIFRRRVNLDKLQKDGWSRNNEKPTAIFLMEQNEYLAGYSVDPHGQQFVKLQAITDFKPTEKASNQGSRFLPIDVKISLYATLGPEARNNLPNLIVPKAQKANNAGIPLNSVAYQDEINLLHLTLTTHN